MRLMLYDETCPGRGLLPGLTTSWRVGGWLYGKLGRLDDWKGASSWEAGLDWLLQRSEGQTLRELQYWGHGNWGCILLQRQRLGVEAFTAASHPLHARLLRLRARLTPESLVWLRTCEAFGKEEGHAFARTLADFFQCAVAGHTYVIGPWQSGLHVLRPGEVPDWSVTEGVHSAGGSVGAMSHPFAPNTLTCLHGRAPVPRGSSRARGLPPP